MLTDRLIQTFAKALRIQNTVEKGEDGNLYLVTSCYLNSPVPVYTHRFPLETIFTEIEERYNLSPKDSSSP